MAALPIQLSLDDMKTIAEMVADRIGRADCITIGTKLIEWVPRVRSPRPL